MLIITNTIDISTSNFNFISLVVILGSHALYLISIIIFLFLFLLNVNFTSIQGLNKVVVAVVVVGQTKDFSHASFLNWGLHLFHMLLVDRLLLVDRFITYTNKIGSSATRAYIRMYKYCY